MIVSIIQPCFIPWLGYFEQMALSDLFVYMDDVKYSRKNWRNNNKLLCKSEPKNVSIPVKKTNKTTLINQVYIANNLSWRNDLLNKIKSYYRKAKYYEEIYEVIYAVVSKKHERLSEFNFEMNSALAKYIGIETPIEFSSTVPHYSSDKVSRIIEIVKYFDADVLYDGKSAASFIDRKYFMEQGINVVFQDYQHTPYRQIYSDKFVPYMSVLDLLMNEGSNSLEIIMSSPMPAELTKLRGKLSSVKTFSSNSSY